MALLHQVPQIRLCPKVRVYLVNVLLPVAVVAIVSLCRDGGDPYGVGSEALDVVQLPNDSVKRPSAVGVQIGARGAGVLVLGKSISQQLCGGRGEGGLDVGGIMCERMTCMFVWLLHELYLRGLSPL